MELDKIGGMSQGDLRRFIVNLLQSDPGALPRHLSSNEVLPSPPHGDGDVPVWDAASNRWLPSSQHGIPGTGLAGGILGSKLTWSLGTAPPGGPAVGDLWIYTGTGFYWMFVYDPTEATYTWKYVGGGDYHNLGGSGNPASVNYVDVGTPAQLTIPRSGDYVFQFGCGAYVSTAPATFRAAIKRGAAATADADGFRLEPPTANLVMQGSAAFLFTGCTSGDVYKLQAKISNTNGNIENAWLRVTPRRVN